VILHDILSVDEAHNKALKVEILQSKTPSFRRQTPIEEFASDAGVQPSSTIVDRPPVFQPTNVFASTPATTITAAADSKENLYTKPVIDKCYRCGEIGLRSNECPKRKQVNITDYKDDGEKDVEIEELNDSLYRRAG